MNIFKLKNKKGKEIENLVLNYLEDKINNDNNEKIFLSKIYNLIKSSEYNHFKKFVYNKLSEQNIINTIAYYKNTYPEEFNNKQIILLTDVKLNSLNYKIINIDNIEHIHEYNDKQFIFIVGYNQDFNNLKAVAEIESLGLKYYGLHGGILTQYWDIDKDAFETLIDEYTKKDRLPHFCSIDFATLFQAIKITEFLEGDYVEIGTYQGASARAVLNYLKRTNIKRKTYFLDTFEGFTYDIATKSQDQGWKNSHTETSENAVRNFLIGYDNFSIIKSNICEDDLPKEIEKFAVANIDVDMYDAVLAALNKVKDKIVLHGIICVEDYGHAPSLIGAQKAVEEFLLANKGYYMPILTASSHRYLIKIKE